MKRFLFSLLIVLMVFCNQIASAGEVERISSEKLPLNASYSNIVNVLNAYDVPYKLSGSSSSAVLSLNTSCLGFNDAGEFTSRLYFDENQRLSRISITNLCVDSFKNLYSKFSSSFGAVTDIDLAPYIKGSTDGESYARHMIPVYFLWEQENRVYELSVYTRVNTSIEGTPGKGIWITPHENAETIYHLTIYENGTYSSQ